MQTACPSHSCWITLTIQRTPTQNQVGMSGEIMESGSRKTLHVRSQITKNNFLNSCFMENKISLSLIIGNCRNVRGLGKSKVVFHFFEKLRYSNDRSTKFKSLYQEYKYSEEENGEMVAL